MDNKLKSLKKMLARTFNGDGFFLKIYSLKCKQMIIGRKTLKYNFQGFIWVIIFNIYYRRFEEGILNL